jgi:hypothetical protein
MVASMGIASALRDLFVPLPGTSVSQEKDPLDHIADHVSSSTGAWDIFRVGEHALQALQLYLPSSHQFADLTGRMVEVFSAAGAGLSIPQLFADMNALRRSAIQLFTVQDLPYSDPLRGKKITQAAKTSFLDSMNLTNTVAQIALFIDGAKIFLIDKIPLQMINGVYNITSFITDGAEFVGECFKLEQYHSPAAAPRNASEAAKLEQKKTLSWMTIAKSIASVALAVIALGALALGVAVSSIPYAAVAVFGISAFWLAMKLTSYFYDKIVVEAPISL